MRPTVPCLAIALLLAACAAPMPGVPVVPPLPAETIPLPPVSDESLTWQPGDWTYFGGSYRYEPGHYVPARGHSAAWLFGHWVGAQGQYGWVPGGWN